MGLYHDVATLYVTMYNGRLPGMQVPQRSGDAKHDLVLMGNARELWLYHEVLQVAALQQFKDQPHAGSTRIYNNSIEFHYVGMVQVPHYVQLIAQGGQSLPDSVACRIEVR